MANIKISALPTTGTLLSTHIIPIVDTASSTTKTATAQVLLNYITSSTFTGLTLNSSSVIDVSTANAALRVTQRGSGESIRVEDETNPDTTPFIVDAAGNVGIGTSNPGAKLDIQQSIKVGISSSAIADETAVATRFTYADPGGVNSGDGIGVKIGMLNRGGVFLGQIYESSNKDGSAFTIRQGSDATSYTETLRINSAGNVGIGISSPSTKLHVSGGSGLTINSVNSQWATFSADVASANFMVFQRPGAAAILGLCGGGAGGAISAGTSNDLAIRSEADLYFATSGNNPRAIINSAGNVGIGTSSPVQTLSVTGTLGVSGATTLSTITGTTAQFTTISGSTVTGSTGLFNTVSASYFAPFGSQINPSYSFIGNTGTGIFLPASDTFSISTAGTEAVRIAANNEISASGTGGKFVTQLGTLTGPSYTFIGDSNTGIYSPGADTIAFVEGGTEVLRISSSGQVGIGTTTPNFTLSVTGTLGVSGNTTIANGNLVIGTTGKGIDFSITPNSGTTTPAELFDDYEEGTWSPSLSGTTTAGTFTYNTNTTGSYTKVGNLVNISCYLQVNSTTAALTGAININGLPFVVQNQVYSVCPAGVGYYVTNTPLGSLSFVPLQNTSRINLYRTVGSSSSLNQLLTGSTANELGNTPIFQFSGIYFTDQ